MNTKKTKNKNRAKTAKVLPTDNVASEISEPDVIQQTKCEEKQSEQTSEIVLSENIPTMEEPHPEDVPVKPKRKKGKKKKQDELIDQEKTQASNEDSSTKIVDTLNVVEQPIEMSSDVENQPQSAKPSRKKKNKSKKQIAELNSEEIAETEKSTQEVDMETTSKGDTVVVQETAPKKKHKKKKHPPDSEKSEGVTCTSAFLQLLEPGDSQDESVTAETQNTDDLIPEAIAEEGQEKLDSVQTPKSKKRNKKHRKHSPAVITPEEEQKQSHDDNVELPKEIAEVERKEIKEEEAREDSTNDINKEASPKPKAKIAKPVNKKNKNKNKTEPCDLKDSESATQSINTENKSVPLSEDVKKDDPLIQKQDENVKAQSNLTQTKPIENVSINIETVEVANEKITNVETTEKETEGQVKIETPDILANENVCDQEKESENTFTEVRPSRKKKRSAKSFSENIDIKTATDNKDVSSPINKETEQLEDKNITPDFIHYPRSSSQQQFDTNNNMVIQEIHSPDEVRLGIPILMTVPVIQGSGESPEVRSQMDPLNLEVMELKMSELKTEDTCDPPAVQPETVDETKVMEELKMSIEKSLAELTAIEKDEIEAERQFLDVLQDSLNNPVDVPGQTTENIITFEDILKSNTEDALKEKVSESPCSPPVCPSRKDKKGKSKKKGKKGPSEQTVNTTSNTPSSNVTETKKDSQETSSKGKESKTENTQKQGKQQSTANNDDTEIPQDEAPAFEVYYEPIENFEDALTSSNEDINKTFEMIAKEVTESPVVTKTSLTKPEISITEPEEDRKESKAKEHPVSQPKNLLGHPNIPASSNKDDYKKEKDKPPNSMQAKVKIKDSVEIEKNKKCKESQTLRNKRKQNSIEANTYKINEHDDFVFKYSFRKVFLPNVCHVCNKEMCQRVPCKFCNIVFYCSQKHKDEDWAKHQSLCFAICTITHLKEQKFIYGDAKNITGQDYRLHRMQIILSCEKMLKRKLVPWEQEALLYPRVCVNVACREWRQGNLTDCAGCRQVAFCTDHPEHLPASHQRWCKSYALYHRLVNHQQTQGRLEPRLPSKVMVENYEIPEKVNEVLASLYEEKIDMDDIQYAALTQVASAPLTAAFGYQVSKKTANGLTKKTTFSIHIVGAELQFEADVLHKWERFFLHLRPDVRDLRVALISPNLNPSNLPLDLLKNVKLCEHCRSLNRRLVFSFEDKTTYLDYYTSEDFILPDIVCAFNPSIERTSIYNGKDPWPTTLKCISKLKTPFLLTAYTMEELLRDLSRIKQYSFEVISEPKYNNFASVRPDRNFITDDEIPLLFKNYCFSVVCGA